MEQYIVSAYNVRSETSYTFGPFRTYAAASDFMEKIDKSDSYDEPMVTVLNPPNVLGTGQELSFA